MHKKMARNPKNKWGIGLIVLGMAIAFLLTGWQPNQLPQFTASQSTATTPILARAERSAPANYLPTVNARRLWRDVEALSFQRYTERDRATARQYIVRSLQKSGWTPRLLPFETGTSKGVNIVAEKPGTNPEAGAILLGGHYDTVERSPGADDNATAVAALLEAARVWGKQSTARTLRLVLFDLEEAGLIGSQAFVSTDSLQALRTDLKGTVILDMVGYTCEVAGCQSYPSGLPVEMKRDRGDFLGVIGDSGHPELLASFNPSTTSAQENLPEVLSLSVPVIAGFAPDVVRSDHAPFWQQGLGAVLVTDTGNFRNPHYHQASDRPNSLNREFLTGSVQIVMNAIAQLLQN
jgi:Zn-dependent M28 family amino/carboxypeptidase